MSPQEGPCEVPDTVSQKQFYDAIQGLRDHIDTKHANQRAFIEEKTARIEKVIADHAKEDQAIFQQLTGRVLVIETERDSERAENVKKSALVSAVIAPSAIAVWEIIKHGMGWGK